MSTAKSSDRDPSPSAGRTLTVLEALVAANGGLTLTALARKTGIPMATCASIVYTLELRGYASRRVVGRSHFWQATLALYGLAVQLTRKADLATIAQREMQELAERLDMPVHIGVLNGASVVYVAKAASPGIIQFDTYPGKVSPFNLTALGKAIAAFLSEEELEPLLSRMKPATGPKAPTGGVETFKAQLVEIRSRRFAVEDEEEEARVGCVAVPFFDAQGKVAGAVGVTGFAKDLTAAVTRKAKEGLTQLADHISRHLGAQAP
ncbi:IclR family transcriptional regulator [Nonomuraea basaltis]|uniref:IclR family transcriptional regulator n=1 Tax=Nonomuraea basaltis TaxID=2495887 RepID=UPI00110C68C2|nr:IclR family transcriptional regulator [Nonomuraea basaltis]TMR96564.1 IclR family transcriptional regulator [Nonomuraea basaltis]